MTGTEAYHLTLGWLPTWRDVQLEPEYLEREADAFGTLAC